MPAHAYVPPLLCTPMLVGGRGATFPSPDTNPSNGRRSLPASVATVLGGSGTRYSCRSLYNGETAAPLRVLTTRVDSAPYRDQDQGLHCFTGVGFYPVWAVRIMCGPLDLTAEKGTFSGGRVAHIPHPVRNMGRAVSTWVEGCAHPSTQRSGPDSLQYGGVACNLCSWIGNLPLVATSSGWVGWGKGQGRSVAG